jgi:formylglycine-generating enzyme required for sulfatase activity
MALWAFAAAGQSLPGTVISKPDNAQMVLVPAGPFIYGVDQQQLRALLKRINAGWAEIYATEQPKQTLTLPAFYIDRFEVTNELYRRFVDATKYNRPSRYARYPQLNGARQPVVGVGWKDAEAYCAWSGKRLPTEQEWEKAARGTDGRTWPWGNEPDVKRYNGKLAGYFAPVQVGSYGDGESPFGVADMAGNVWEMTSSTWKGTAKAMRGGSFLNRLADVRVTARWAAQDEDRGANWLGFRCATDAEAARKFDR